MENEFDWNKSIPKEQQLSLTIFQNKTIPKDLPDDQAIKTCTHKKVIYDFKGELDSNPDLVCIDCGKILRGD
jgi:hypothetical protein